MSDDEKSYWTAEDYRAAWHGWSEARRAAAPGSPEYDHAIAALVALADAIEVNGIDLADDVTAERELQAAARLMAAIDLPDQWCMDPTGLDAHERWEGRE